MANTINSVELDFSYSNTDFTRTYKIVGIATEDMQNVKEKILNYNANIPEADKKVFIADDFDDSDPEFLIGYFEKISGARLVMVEEEQIV